MTAGNDSAVVIRTAFTDEPLVPAATVIKAVHLTELRGAIVFSGAGGPPAAYTTDHVISPGTATVRAAHLNEACGALKAAYASVVCTAAAAGQPVRASDFTALRTAFRALERWSGERVPALFGS